MLGPSAFLSLASHVVIPMLPSQHLWLQLPPEPIDETWVIQRRMSGMILNLPAVPAQSFAFQGMGGAGLVPSPAFKAG